MTERSNPIGKIEISTTAIANLAVTTVLECYGVVGLAGKTKFEDWRKNVLNIEDAQRGVEVAMDEEDGITIDLYIVVQYGTRISEVARGVMNRVHYTLEQTVGLPVRAVNVHVQALRVNDHA
ncbi:MAG: Asp23/Gls24 family envelope stress response protein [Caldilineales bacterium]|nr:Asp23/Gls24 family envelope stress response protein [Caldilineales bacterium]